MKKRKYFKVMLLLVISFFSLLLIACESEDKPKEDDVKDIDNKDNNGNHQKDQDKNNPDVNPNDHPQDDDDEKELEPSQYYFYDDYDNRVDLRSEEQIDGFLNYEKDIYFVSSRIKTMKVGDAINICGKNGVVGLNVFDTMANCLIYVNALGPSQKPTLYLDSGKINEVFHFYHDNLTVYGPYAGVTDEELREASVEAVFTGSVSVRGDNITIDGVAVDDLDHTITIYGKNVILNNIVKNKG